MKDVGKKIRAERTKRGLTLEWMAERTGLSRSCISNMERGLTEPGISSLEKIADKLQLDMISLLGEKTAVAVEGEDYSNSAAPESREPGFIQDVIVVEPDRRKTFTLAGSDIHYELLTPDLDRRFQAHLFRAEPGGELGAQTAAGPPGEKFVLVLKGAMEMRTGDEVHVLKPGAAIYFPADVPYSWKVIGEEALEVLEVVCPPRF